MVFFCETFQNGKDDMNDSSAVIERQLDMDVTLEDNNLKVLPVQNVARQDSGVPEDLLSPVCDVVTNKSLDDDDPDCTMNSDCNITVIHVTESDNRNKEEDRSSSTSLVNIDRKEYTGESKDSKDGSDSGVEGCATEVPRVSKYIFLFKKKKKK